MPTAFWTASGPTPLIRVSGASRPSRLRNGAGKTTLFKCLAGLIETDEGRRTIQPGTKVVLLEQDPPVADFATLREFALHGPKAPAPHEVDSIAGQLGVDLDRPAATASGG